MTGKTDKMFLILASCAAVLVFLTLFFLEPKVEGDSLTYVETVNFLKTGQKSESFLPNRLMTNSGALYSIIILSKIFGSETGVWLALNAVFYCLSAFIFYKLLFLMFENKKTALLGSLFLISNYAFISFGLRYLMDMGGWLFYLLSLFFLFKYLKSGDRKNLLMSSLAVGIGGLFKEYALLGVIPIAFFLIYENKRSIVSLFKKSILPAVIAILPTAAAYIWVYLKFDYTYADWVKDSYKYDYSSDLWLRTIEYIKSLGSLYNVLAIFVLLGIWVFWKERKNLNQKTKLFTVASILSFLPVFFWGGITQRIYFITVPALVFVACFFFKKYENKFYYFLPALGLYAISSFLMDAFILPNVNLPI